MIQFIFRRLSRLLPTVLGVSMVTFVLVNLALGHPEMRRVGSSVARVQVDDGLSRLYGIHLPLFLNFSIEDAQTRTRRDIQRLGNDATRLPAMRSLIRTGGCAMPYLTPILPRLKDESKLAALDVLDAIGKRMGIAPKSANTAQREAAWIRFWDIYGSDFTSVRSARLVRRVIRRADPLALYELKRLDTFSIPDLMEMLDENRSESANDRIVSLLCELTGRNDPLTAGMSKTERAAIINRWQEWWFQRYDLYTTFDGWRMVVGAVTQTRYFRWLSRVFTFEFGISVQDGLPISAKIAKRLPITLLLTFLALLVAYGLAIPFGVLSAVNRDTVFDKVTNGATFILFSLPAFWVAMLFLRYFGNSNYFGWFPTGGLNSTNMETATSFEKLKDTAHHLVLPVLCLSMVSVAILTRFQRVGMLRVFKQDFMRTARAKGLTRGRVILKHGLRNGVIPLVTMIGVQLPYLVSGSVVVEHIFGIPGMGFETFNAIQVGDYPWLVAVVTVTAVLTILGALLSDVIYALIDPRIVPGRRFGRWG